jgi:hypothetical protein
MSEIETEVQAWKVTLTTDCECTDEDGNQTDDCFGCYDDNVVAFNELIAEWVERNGKVATDSVKVASGRMNWNGVSGYAVTDLLKIAEVIAIRGQYRLDFKLDGLNLTCNRYSHDEPTGAHFTLDFVSDETEHTH